MAAAADSALPKLITTPFPSNGQVCTRSDMDSWPWLLWHHAWAERRLLLLLYTH